MTKTKKKPQKKKKITPRQRKFAEFYIESGNTTQSYIKAGYSENGANKTASRLLVNEGVRQYIEQRRKEIGENSDITAQMVINELAKPIVSPIRLIKKTVLFFLISLNVVVK